MREERVTMTNKDGKKKSHLLIRSSVSNGGGGGDGIGGLLVFGGALAVAGFIAVASFATNKNKAKAKTKGPLTKPKPKLQQLLLEDGSKSQNDHDHDHEIETTPNNDGNAVSTCHGTSDMSISQTLILEEEKIDPNLNTCSEVVSPTCFHHQEIVLSDDSHPESAASSNKNEIEEECLASLFDSPSPQAQEVDQDEPQESLKSIEIETEKDKDDHDNTNEDGVALESGEEEDSSKATEGTSLNSNEEPVWPAELIEEAEQDCKGEGEKFYIQSEAQGATKTDISASADYCDSHFCSDADVDGSYFVGTNGAMTVTPEATSNEKANFSLVLNDQPSGSHSFQLRTWLMPMLLLASLLLLVLLTHRTHQSFPVLDEGNSVIIP